MSKISLKKRRENILNLLKFNNHQKLSGYGQCVSYMANSRGEHYSLIILSKKEAILYRKMKQMRHSVDQRHIDSASLHSENIFLIVLEELSGDILAGHYQSMESEPGDIHGVPTNFIPRTKFTNIEVLKEYDGPCEDDFFDLLVKEAPRTAPKVA